MSDFDQRRRGSGSGPTHGNVQPSPGKRSMVEKRYADAQQDSSAPEKAPGNEAAEHRPAQGLQETRRSVADSGGPLSFLDRMQPSFAEHDISSSAPGELDGEEEDQTPGKVASTTRLPDGLSGEIYIRIFARELGKNLTREDALKEWARLSAAEQARLRQKYRIEAYSVG
ncbi:MAG TPA: hypothetical protein VNO33_04305 [Kofleriaceae bacterium]|nr:hypothetical protein [Kofleriaceae bacterium]